MVCTVIGEAEEEEERGDMVSDRWGSCVAEEKSSWPDTLKWVGIRAGREGSAGDTSTYE